MAKMPSPEDIYAVVCTDLHVAYGPVLGQPLAERIARKMTEEEGPCVYVPIHFVSMGGRMSAIAYTDDYDGADDGTADYRGGQYL